MALTVALAVAACTSLVSPEPPPYVPSDPEAQAVCDGGRIQLDNGKPVEVGDAKLNSCISQIAAYTSKVAATVDELGAACARMAAELELNVKGAGLSAGCHELLSALDDELGTPLPVSCTSFGSCSSLALQCTATAQKAAKLATALQNHGASVCAAQQCGVDTLEPDVACASQLDPNSYESNATAKSCLRAMSEAIVAASAASAQYGQVVSKWPTCAAAD